MNTKEKAIAAGIVITPIVENIIKRYENDKVLQRLIPEEEYIKYIVKYQRENII